MKISKVIVITLAVISVSQASYSDQIESCLSAKMGKSMYFDVDNKNRRIFVVLEIVELPTAELFQPIIYKANLCLSDKEFWKDKYSISFFSSKEHAGYKTEEKNIKGVMSGEWSNSYLAEYTLTLHKTNVIQLSNFFQSIQVMQHFALNRWIGIH